MAHQPIPLSAHARPSTAAQRAEAKADEATRRVDLFQGAVQRVEDKLDKLLKAIGEEHESERGEKLGTGLIGRMMRHEIEDAKRFSDLARRISRWDRWKLLATGFGAAVVFLGPVLWWLVSDRIAFLK